MLKSIKKTILLTLLITVTIAFVACDYGYYFYGDSIHKGKEVVRIELINYNNPIVKDNPLEKHPLDLEKVEVLEILNDNSVDAFINELIGLSRIASKPKEVMNSPNGVGVRISHSDNSFTLITIMELAVANKNGIDAVFTGDYDADSNIVRVMGFSWQELTDDFKALINEFFTVQIS